MSDIRSDIDPDAPDDLVELAERLRTDRRQPPAEFRGSLRGMLAGRAPRPRPAGLRLSIIRYAAASAVLLALGALGAAGTGPLGI